MAAVIRRTCWLVGLSLSAASVGGNAPAAEIIAAITAEQLHMLVEEQRGKVVVVNFWATWCPPCLREFPAIIDVYERYRERGVEVLAVSMNSADEAEDVEQFLATYDPPFPVYIAASQDKTFYEGVLPQWFGEMPMTLIFDAAGTNARVHKKPLTHEELASDVSALLSLR